MKGKTMGTTIDVTVSGYVRYEYSVGESYQYRPGGFWKPYGGGEVDSKTVNAACIECFREITYPILDIKVSLKPGVGAFKRWWYSSWDDRKAYDVEIKEIGKKTVTYVRFVSGKDLYADQSADVFRKAIDGLRFSEKDA